MKPTITISALAFAAAAAVAAPPYHLTDMGDQIEALFPGNEFISSQCRGLNNNGDAVGEIHLDNGSQQSFIFTFEHGLVVLPRVPGGLVGTRAMDLTDRDANGEIIIVGGSVHGMHDYPEHAAIWRFSAVSGEILEARNAGNLPGSDEAVLVAVSNAGIAVGYDGENGPSVPVKYDIHADVLETLDFPTRPADINAAGQIVGGRYLGDLAGNTTEIPVPADCTSLTLTGINENGWLVGRAGRPYSDGAGRLLASWGRFTDAGWHVPNPGSPWDTGFRMNTAGDITVGYGAGWMGGYYDGSTGDEFALTQTLGPEIAGQYEISYAYGINDNQQVAASARHAVLLTPIGRMIIPGDVNGDVSVDLDDHCAWLDNPIDLNGDGAADGADELWLIERLFVFGFEVLDCNSNGVGDHCDILSFASGDCNSNGVPDECEPDCNGDGVPDSCEPDCNGNGVPDPCDIDAGVSDDCNSNGIPDECDTGRHVEAVNAFGDPVPMYAGASFTDQIIVFDQGTIGDVDFRLELDYRIGYLGVTLEHNGVLVTLIDRPGYPNGSSLGNGQLGYDIVLDDQGSGGAIEQQGSFGSPFGAIVSPPAYTPNEPLAVFNGMPVDGDWAVTVWTTESASPVLARSWNMWGLSIEISPEDVSSGCGCVADVAAPFGILDLADVQFFITGFITQDPIADLDGSGVFDLADVQAFIGAFTTGCT